MRLLLPVLLLVCLAVVLASPFKQPGTKVRRVGADNRLAIQKGLALPRPGSIPMRCDRSNSTCLAELRKPRHRKRQTNPSATTIPSSTQNYQNSCTSTNVGGTVASPALQAMCKTQTGQSVYTEFRLGSCVAFGLLGMECNVSNIPPTLFESACKDCRLEGTTLNCKCGLFRSTLNLSSCFGNENGKLVCRPPIGL